MSTMQLDEAAAKLSGFSCDNSKATAAVRTFRLICDGPVPDDFGLVLNAAVRNIIDRTVEDEDGITAHADVICGFVRRYVPQLPDQTLYCLDQDITDIASMHCLHADADIRDLAARLPPSLDWLRKDAEAELRRRGQTTYVRHSCDPDVWALRTDPGQAAPAACADTAGSSVQRDATSAPITMVAEALADYLCEFGDNAAPEVCMALSTALEFLQSLDVHTYGSLISDAVRYACGRMTYMPAVVCEYLTPLLPVLPTVVLFDLKAAVLETGGRRGYGDEKIDRPVWMNLLRSLTAELDGREQGSPNAEWLPGGDAAKLEVMSPR